jgi:hypothetical protein
MRDEPAPRLTHHGETRRLFRTVGHE